MRFWFRFVQPFQGELEAGADPIAHVDSNVMPRLADHTAPVFEETVTTWMRLLYPGSTEVGAWWGHALKHLRAIKERHTEEIDVTALSGTRVTAAAEAKWTNKAMGADVLSDLLDLKLPAMTQAGFSTGGARVVLASRGGFTKGLRELADATPNVTLIDASELLRQLVSNVG